MKTGKISIQVTCQINMITKKEQKWSSLNTNGACLQKTHFRNTFFLEIQKQTILLSLDVFLQK